jgi:hypothetical protein
MDTDVRGMQCGGVYNCIYALESLYQQGIVVDVAQVSRH